MCETKNEILESVKKIADFLINTQDLYNQELALYVMQFSDNEPLKNYVNFYEAYIIIAELGNIELAKICKCIAESEISLEKGCKHDNHYRSFLELAVEKRKDNIKESDYEKPTQKDKYLYVLEFCNGTVKIGITKEKEKRMKAISSASGMNILRSYFTEKIDNVQNLEAELHRYFKDNRLNGEFFSISFEEAVSEVIKRTIHQIG